MKNNAEYMKEHSLECRDIPVEVRADTDGDSDTITGVPIVFNSTTNIGGMWNESIAPDAISPDALKDVAFFVNHNVDDIPLARSRRNTPNSTMRLSIENDGVHMEADLDRNNPEASQLLSAVKRGDVTGMSFMFHVSGEEWSDLDSEVPTRRITGIDHILEVSAVTYPAYEATTISARSTDVGKAALDRERKALDDAKKVDEARKQTIDKIDELLKGFKHE